VAVAYFLISAEFISIRRGKTRPATAASIRLVWPVHCRVRNVACDGSLDALGARVLVVWRRQSNYGGGFGTDRRIAGKEYARGAALAQRSSIARRQRGIGAAGRDFEAQRRTVPADGGQHPGNFLDDQSRDDGSDIREPRIRTNMRAEPRKSLLQPRPHIARSSMKRTESEYL